MPKNEDEARRSKQKKYYKKWYAKNRKKRIKQAAYYRDRSRKRNRKYVIDFKLKHPCECGECEPVCLSFHHVRGEKLANVADLVNSACGLKKLQEEMDKCDIMCLNCHARITNGHNEPEAVKRKKPKCQRKKKYKQSNSETSQ